MPSKLTQANSLLQLTSPLGEDVLIPIKLVGNEQLSENFEWTIHCLLNADESPVDPQEIVGKSCHVNVSHGDTDTTFEGLCASIEFIGFRFEYALYKLVLRPWTWLLTLETESEIFHEKSCEDIIKQVFDDRGFSDYEFRLTSSYDPIPYCVQYQETTYNFVSRLMEKFGMFFYFKCEAGKHTLMIIDDVTNCEDIEAADPKIKYQSNTGTGIREHRFFDWGTSDHLRTAKIDVDDYNYEKPNTALEKTGNPKDSPGHSYNEQTQYIYPSGHLEPGIGQKLADVRVDSVRAEAQRMEGQSNVPAVRAGCIFELDEHPTRANNKKYLIIGVKHEVFVVTYLNSSNFLGYVGPDLKPTRDALKHPILGNDFRETNGYYFGQCEVADKTVAYKAPLKSPPPRIAGAQTAVVIKTKNAPADEEIDVDDEGRILVKFHWNDGADESDKCSCRVRVAQLWAGSGWGGVWIPRVDMEVVVEFLEGDPDRPLVTGCVYNGNNKPPISFPADKTQSTIKSQSSKGGTSSANFNELRFEDKKDDEEIYIHAERDRMMIIEHDDDIEIGNDQTEKIGGSRTFELTGGDETVTLKGAPGTKDKYGKTITKKGHRTTTLKEGDETLKVEKGKRTTTIKMNDKRTITDGDDITEVSKGDQTNTVKMGDQTNTIKMGDQTTKISLGKGTTTAMTSFEIKVGASSMKLEPAKITIKSPEIMINASGMLTAKAGGMATFQAGGINTVKGSMVKIN